MSHNIPEKMAISEKHLEKINELIKGEVPVCQTIPIASLIENTFYSDSENRFSHWTEHNL